VQIDAGGIVEIGPGSAWTFIGVAGDMIVNGELRAQGNGDYLDAPLMVTAAEPDEDGKPFGELLGHTITQGKGGMGGSCPNPVDRTPGKDGFGNGGGGMGWCYYAYGSWHADQTGQATFGKDASLGAGGDGGEPSHTECGTCFPGKGATLHGMNGEDGVTMGCGQYGCGGGSGAGGGSRGRHGQALYIKVKGNLAGNGSISAAGQPGGLGGDGAPGDCNKDCACCAAVSGGSGGGGAAGGAGGAIVIRYHGQIAANLAQNIKTNGGKGGLGGKPGGNLGAGGPGGDGKPGEDGADGPPPDISKY
jgi:hypothetical protein